MMRSSLSCVFFQAMKGEKGIPGVSAGDSLGEELTDDSFSKLLQSTQASDTLLTNRALISMPTSSVESTPCEDGYIPTTLNPAL